MSSFVKTRCRWIVRVTSEGYTSKPQKTARDAKSLVRMLVASGFSRPTIHKSCALRRKKR